MLVPIEIAHVHNWRRGGEVLDREAGDDLELAGVEEPEVVASEIAGGTSPAVANDDWNGDEAGSGFKGSPKWEQVKALEDESTSL